MKLQISLLCGFMFSVAGMAQGAAVSIAFWDNGKLQGVPREIAEDASRPQAALAALVAGPTAEECGAGLTSAIPAGTRLLSIEDKTEPVTLHFSSEIVSTGFDDAMLESIAAQVVWTLRSAGVESYPRLVLDGQLLAAYLPPVNPIDAPAKDASPQNATPPIITAGTALTGRKISLSPGHGYVWTGSSYAYERPVYCAPLTREDHHNVDLMIYLNKYLTQDGATTKAYRCLDQSLGNHPVTGQPWWYMSAGYWVKNLGYPCSVYANSTGDCTLGSGASESNDSLRSRPLASDYDAADLYVSIHTNGLSGNCLGTGCPNGTCTYYDTSSEHATWGTISKNLATAVNTSMVDVIRNRYGDTSWQNRGALDSSGNFAETRIPNRAAILIELAFHDTCDRDGLYLQDNFFRSATMWGAYQGICTYLGTTPTYDFYSDEYVSDTIPAQMVPHQTYNVSITLRNRGVLWTEARSIRLGAVGDSDPFSAATRVTVPGEIDPGNTCTFSLNLTAPGTPGTYTTDWRMLRESVAWFGATVSKQIDVQYPGCPADFDDDEDVDAEDFGHFQLCLTGVGVPQDVVACQDAKLDTDNDVDNDDFLVFQACMSGPGIAADVDCANP